MRKVPRSVRHFTIVTFRDVHCDPNCLNFPFQSPPKLVIIGADDDYDILEEAVEVNTDDDESNIGSPAKLAARSRPGSGTSKQSSDGGDSNFSSGEDLTTN